MNGMVRLKILLRTKDGREKLHSELGDYKHFISICQVPIAG